MKSFIKHFISLMMITVLLLTNVIGVSASEMDDENTVVVSDNTGIGNEDAGEDDENEDIAVGVDNDTFLVATVFDAAVESELKINEKKHKFSNSSNGSFDLEYAQDEDYFIGSVVDTSTDVTYCLLTYEEKLYLVVADGSSKYRGTYHDRSFIKLESKKYNEKTQKISLMIANKKAEYTTRMTSFHYNEDYSVRVTGWYEGLYYSEGELATDIVPRSGNYDLFNEGRLISNDGWYQVQEKQIKIVGGHVSLVFDGKNCFQYTGTACNMVKGKAVTINNVSYRFDKAGELANGLFTIRGCYYYYTNGIKLCNAEKKAGKYYYYFQSDGKAVTDTWLSMKNMLKYYDEKGICSKIFYTDAYKGKNKNKFKQLVNGKWKFAGKGVYEINGTYYLFKGNGTRYIGTKWYQDNNKTYYYVKKGVVINKLLVSKSTYKYYYNENGKWKYARNVWVPKFENTYMKTNEKGVVTVKYYKSNYSKKSYQGTYWKYDGSTWKKTKKAVVEVNGNYYCLDKKGKTVRTNGWYTLTARKTAYISKSGKVYKYVYYDASKKCSVYKTGYGLNKSSAGYKTAKINGKTVYYYSDVNGMCVTNTSKTKGDYVYKFDKYGIAYSKIFCGNMNCDYDLWMKRVMNNLLGETGIPCNVFVEQAFHYAGGDDSSVKNTVKYNSFDEGGIVINSASNCSAWINSDITAEAVLSDGSSWQDSKEYTLNGVIEEFSYDNLAPGDVIAYYAYGDYEHISIYIGQFDSAADVKAYLVSLGVSRKKAEECVRTWGAFYDNDATYWCIHGGMGSNSEVYISNTCYEIPMGGSSEVATKIIKMFNNE